MQKFLVGPNIGGASISFGAACYLIKYCGEGLDPIWQHMNENQFDKITESSGEVGFVESDLFSPLLAEWWQQFRSRHVSVQDFPFDINVKPSSEVPLLYGDTMKLREMLIPFIERLEGDFEKFDEANNNTALRIVEVPEGYFCGVINDPESGCECVEEFPQMWHAMYDSEYRFLAVIRKFCNREADDCSWYADGKVYDLGSGVKLAFSGNFALARCIDNSDKKLGTNYVFLKKNTYYRATKDHPKVVFEVLGHRHTRLAGLDTTFRDADEVEAYAGLVALLSKEE